MTDKTPNLSGLAQQKCVSCALRTPAVLWPHHPQGLESINSIQGQNTVKKANHFLTIQLENNTHLFSHILLATTGHKTLPRYKRARNGVRNSSSWRGIHLAAVTFFYGK